MLKSIAWCNMINYKERQNLFFSNGVNFIIGANGTGKSSILELIRRCHSQKLNDSFSNVFNKEEIAYVVCLYENCKEYLIGDEFRHVETERMLSCIFREKDHGNIVKVVCFRGRNSPDTKLCVAATEYDDKPQIPSSSKTVLTPTRLFSLQPLGGDAVKRFMQKYLDNEYSDTDVEEEFLAYIGQHLCNFQISDNDACTAEYILEKMIPAFVVVFPMRSLAPVQWTEALLKPEVEDHYRQSYKAAEILRNLLPDESESGSKCSKIDVNLEKEYFTNITYPLQYEFIKSEKEEDIKVKTRTSSEVNKTFQLLKAPEGVIEAKQASLILAHKKFKTICYEDLGKGMHHQMIENLSHFVLKPMDKKEKSKTVIVVTHEASFIDSWSLGRTFICTRQWIGTPNIFMHIVRRVPEGYKYGYDSEMKKALFASNVLLVEGRLDHQVLRSFFNFMLTNGQELSRICTEIKTETPRLIRALSNTQIIALGGAKGRENAMKFCKDIGVPVMTLIDKDAVGELQPENEYSWRTGTIEDAIRNDCSSEFLASLGISKKRGNESKEKEKEMRRKLKNKIIYEFTDSHYENLFVNMCVNESSEFGQFLLFFLRLQIPQAMTASSSI